jgi:PHD/YefM family antitoxin component YafN of YafNO toxin-antitoxin module
MLTIPVTLARKQFLTLVDQVDEEYIRVDLTKRGRVAATLVAPDYLDALEETVFSLTNSAGEIRKAKREIKSGKYVTLEQLKKQIK